MLLMKAVESFTLDQVSQAQTKGRNWHISVLMERSSVGCPLPPGGGDGKEDLWH